MDITFFLSMYLVLSLKMKSSGTHFLFHGFFRNDITSFQCVLTHVFHLLLYPYRYIPVAGSYNRALS